MRVIGISNKGLKKEINEDCYLIDDSVLYDSSFDSDKATAAFVCDGVSNSNSSLQASKFVCEEISDTYLNVKSEREYINSINNKLIKNYKDSHTTIAGVFIKEDKITSVNVGDTKVYILKNDVLTQISIDDTYYEYLKSINDPSYVNYKNSHIITACLGSKVFNKNSVHVVDVDNDLKKGDCIVVCSDGVSDMVEKDKLEYYLSLKEALEVRVDKIEKRITFKGAKDNYTMLVIEF
jgi:protein phosphatase